MRWAYLSVLTRRSRYRTGLQSIYLYTVQGCAQTRLLRAGSGGQRESRAGGSVEAASQLHEAACGHRSAARGSVWRCGSVEAAKPGCGVAGGVAAELWERAHSRGGYVSAQPRGASLWHRGAKGLMRRRLCEHILLASSGSVRVEGSSSAGLNEGKP